MDLLDLPLLSIQCICNVMYYLSGSELEGINNH